MSSKLKRIMFRGVLSLLAVFFTLLLLEVLFRAIPGLGAGGPVKLDRPEYFYAFDNEQEHPWARGASNVFQVIVIGDSFAAGSGVRIDESFGCQLERLMNMNRDVIPCQVDIVAKCGWCTAQELDLLPKAFTHHANLVVLSVCLNDTEDWSNPKELMQLRDRIFAKPLPPGLATVVHKSRVLHALYRKIDAIRSRRAYARYYEHIHDPEYSGYRRFKAAVRTFHEQCRDHNIPVVAVIFPLLAQDLHHGMYPYADMHAGLREVFSENDIPCLDLLSAYEDLSPVRLTAIPSIDEHPNEIAHRIAAEQLLIFLDEQHLIDHAYIPHRKRQKNAHDIWKRTIRRMEG